MVESPIVVVHPMPQSDYDNWQPMKAWYQKGNNYKKTTSQSTFIGELEELVTDTFAYGAIMGKNCVNSKEACTEPMSENHWRR